MELAVCSRPALDLCRPTWPRTPGGRGCLRNSNMLPKWRTCCSHNSAQTMGFLETKYPIPPLSKPETDHRSKTLRTTFLANTGLNNGSSSEESNLVNVASHQLRSSSRPLPAGPGLLAQRCLETLGMHIVATEDFDRRLENLHLVYIGENDLWHAAGSRMAVSVWSKLAPHHLLEVLNLILRVWRWVVGTESAATVTARRRSRRASLSGCIVRGQSLPGPHEMRLCVADVLGQRSLLGGTPGL